MFRSDAVGGSGGGQYFSFHPEFVKSIKVYSGLVLSGPGPGVTGSVLAASL